MSRTQDAATIRSNVGTLVGWATSNTAMRADLAKNAVTLIEAGLSGLLARTPAASDGKNWYGSTMERAGAAARHATPTPDDRDREVKRIATVCYCRMCTLLRDLDHLRAELEPLQSVLNGILSDGPVMDTLAADGPWWTPPDPTGVRLHDALIAASKAVDRAIDAGLRASGGD